MKISLIFIFLFVNILSEVYTNNNKEKSNDSSINLFLSYVANRIRSNFNIEDYMKYYDGFVVLVNDFYKYFLTDWKQINRLENLKSMNLEKLNKTRDLEKHNKQNRNLQSFYERLDKCENGKKFQYERTEFVFVNKHINRNYYFNNLTDEERNNTRAISWNVTRCLCPKTHFACELQNDIICKLKEVKIINLLL